jgi:hypothetical protein
MISAYTAWHLNLNFSAIEIEDHRKVISDCYWPLLELCEADDNKFGVEMSASTLNRIKQLDSTWLDKARSLQNSNKLEVIASGWSQIISPLVPWQVTEKNLRLGNEFYFSEFGKLPRVAFINEQAWSDGLFDLYVNAGFEAVIIEWENSFSANKHWAESVRNSPVTLQRDNRELLIIWNHSTSFQKIQRLAHKEISMENWKTWFSAYCNSREDSAICIYGGDVETIGFRPKRYISEAEPNSDEWDAICKAFNSQKQLGVRFTLPSQLLDAKDVYPRVNSISSLTMPIPTKKQPKYNPLRWAVGGRDSVMANTVCQRVFENLKSKEIEDSVLWMELLELWASDFRTHITESRWTDWVDRSEKLQSMTRLPTLIPNSLEKQKSQGFEVLEDDYTIQIANDKLRILLSKRKGLAVKELYFYSLSQDWLVGTFEHGDNADIEWNADFFTGEFVLEPPGLSKVSDLVPVIPKITNESDYLSIKASIKSRLGTLEKEIRLYPESERVDFVYTPSWGEIPAGSLRFGDIVLNPAAFELTSLTFGTHNGGIELETFELGELNIDQGRSWSALVSARQCFGITEGFCLIGDRFKKIRISNNHFESKVPAILTFQNFKHNYLFRLQFSGRELDDTSFQHKINLFRNPRVFQVSIEPEKEQHG